LVDKTSFLFEDAKSNLKNLKQKKEIPSIKIEVALKTTRSLTGLFLPQFFEWKPRPSILFHINITFPGTQKTLLCCDFTEFFQILQLKDW